MRLGFVLREGRCAACFLYSAVSTPASGVGNFDYHTVRSSYCGEVGGFICTMLYHTLPRVASHCPERIVLADHVLSLDRYICPSGSMQDFTSVSVDLNANGRS